MKKLLLSLLLFFVSTTGNIFAQGKHNQILGQQKHSALRAGFLKHHSIENIPVTADESTSQSSSLPGRSINPPLQPASLIALYDSVYYWSWDTVTSGWAAAY